MSEQLPLLPGSVMKRSADFSPCWTWRYTLIREWDDSLPRLLFVLLNPSTADAEKDDPTNRKGIKFAKLWGYGAVVFVNLFAIRSPYPEKIRVVGDPIGPENNAWIRRQVLVTDDIIVAWGMHGDDAPRHRDRPEAVLNLLPRPVFCMGTTKDGHPKHPLYLPHKTEMTEFRY
ncbi:MAG: DUF1643 domain-containing protein [Bacteroidetes bacterium]|nr:DUF1643 domain-containing protein [Bacteroidota bacterium]